MLKLPGYRLIEKLGEGGHGQVFRGEQLDTRAIVAIKLLSSSTPTAQHREEFQRESLLMASLNHPHVVRIFEIGEYDSHPFLAMEYVQGPSFRSFLGTPWPLPAAFDLLWQIGGALDYIHQQGILHLDMKPENILLEARTDRLHQVANLKPGDLLAKLTDFGLAHLQHERTAILELEQVQGTIDYCPPELRHGLPVDARSDLFAFATLAYEMLTGRLPRRVYVPASLYHPETIQELDPVLRKALARDREERQGSVREFLNSLQSALAKGVKNL